MKRVIGEICKEKNISHVFQKAPVKTADRCVIKSAADYGNRTFPTAACILDFLRCSITFKNTKHIMVVLNEFLDRINKGQAGCVR